MIGPCLICLNRKTLGYDMGQVPVIVTYPYHHKQAIDSAFFMAECLTCEIRVAAPKTPFWVPEVTVFGNLASRISTWPTWP